MYVFIFLMDLLLFGVLVCFIARSIILPLSVWVDFTEMSRKPKFEFVPLTASEKLSVVYGEVG